MSVVGRTSWRRRDGRGGFFQTFDLLEEAAAAAPDHRSSGTLEQAARLRLKPVQSRRMNTAPRPLSFPGWPVRLAGADHRLQSGLQILRVRRGIFVQNHQVDRQLLHPPVFVGAE